MNTPKIVATEYIESGTFVGGENDVYDAGIQYNQTCVSMSEAEWLEYKGRSWANYNALGLLGTRIAIFLEQNGYKASGELQSTINQAQQALDNAETPLVEPPEELVV